MASMLPKKLVVSPFFAFTGMLGSASSLVNFPLFDFVKGVKCCSSKQFPPSPSYVHSSGKIRVRASVV